MVEIGRKNRLTVKRLSRGGCFLDGGTREIYLPKGDTPKGIRPGDTLKVFVYNDAKDSLKATTLSPAAVVGDFAALILSLPPAAPKCAENKRFQ